MILIAGHVRVTESAVEALRPAMAAQLAACRAEDGCIEYSYAIDVIDPARILVHEMWRDWAALEAHFEQPHMEPWRAALGRAGITERSLLAWDVGEGRAV